MIQTKVILEQGDERRKVVRRAVEQLQDSMREKLNNANTVLIKVNLVHHEKQLASTHVDAVRGILDVLRSWSKVKIYVADASYHGTIAAFRNFGYEQLLREYADVELVDLNEGEYVDGYTVRRDGSRNPIRRSALAIEADLSISLAPMKMHRDAGVTLSVKNWTIGTWIVPSRISASGRVWARWPWLHDEGPWAHHASIMELYRQKPCDYAVIDGIVAMEGDGPTRGTPVQMGVVLAGDDAVAVDAVAATLMGVDPGDVGYIAMCAEAGLGVADVGQVDVPPMLMAQLRQEFDRPLGYDDALVAWKNEIPNR